MLMQTVIRPILDSGNRVVGTGIHVKPGVFLTALHVALDAVDDDGFVRVMDIVILGDGEIVVIGATTILCTIEWRPKEAEGFGADDIRQNTNQHLDIALLVAKKGEQPSTGPCARLAWPGSLHPGRSREMSAHGFPCNRYQDPTGRFREPICAGKVLPAEFDNPPDNWKGACGGPLCFDGVVYGVISYVAENADRKLIYAAAIGPWWNEENFRTTIGMPEAHPSWTQDRHEALVADWTSVLEKDDRVRRRLMALAGETAVAGTVSWLYGQKLASVVEILTDLYDTCIERSPAKQQLLEVWFSYMALIFDGARAELLVRNRRNRIHLFEFHDVSRRSAIELIQAAAESRKPNPVVHSDGDFTGKDAVNLPEIGLGGIEDWINSLRQETLRRLGKPPETKPDILRLELEMRQVPRRLTPMPYLIVDPALTASHDWPRIRDRVFSEIGPLLIFEIGADGQIDQTAYSAMRAVYTYQTEQARR